MSAASTLVRVALACAALAAALPSQLSAQMRLVDPRVLAGAPSYRHWTFSTPLATDSFAVSELRQVSVPVTFSVHPLRDWRVDVSAAFADAAVTATSAAGGGTLSLSGPTDVKVRALGAVIAERAWLTFGLNLPVGRVGLSDEEAAVIRIVGAPAFRMDTPMLGTGTGVLVGGIYTPTIGRWAVALGASYEVRGGYTPLEAAGAGGSGTGMTLDPGAAVHLTLGLDRVIGQGRASLLLTANLYGVDVVTRPAAGDPAPRRSEHRLGPAFGAAWEHRWAGRGIRDLRLRLAGIHRTAFRDGSTGKVPGSAGTALDAGVVATVGRPGGIGWVMGAEAVRNSGLDIDRTVATAAMTAGSALLGAELPLGRTTLTPFAKLTYGRIDLGPAATTGRAIGGGITLRSLW